MQIALDEAKDELNELKPSKENLASETELLNHLNETRVEKFQLSILNENYERQNQDKEIQLKRVREELQRISDELKIATSHEFWKEGTELSQEELSKNPQIERVYKQLKQQFEEKSEVLHQTRRELFQVEGKLVALQKECEQSAIDLNPNELVLIDHLKEVEEECKDLETQVECLQELVSELISKKKTTRTKKAKSKEDSLKADLELSF